MTPAEPDDDPDAPLEVDGQEIGDVARESRLHTAALDAPRRRRRHESADVLIVTAVDVELEAMKAAFSASPWRHKDGTRPPVDLWTATVEGDGFRYGVGILKGAGAGTLQTLWAMDYAVRELAPRLVVLGGIAAGRPDGKVALGDLIVSTAIVAIAYEKRRQYVMDQRHEIVTTINRSLIEQLEGFVSREWYETKVAFGHVIATNAVVRDPTYRNRLFADHPDAMGIEMEGGALAEACERNYFVGTRFAVVKAVVDFADEWKDDQAHWDGSDRVARFLHRFLQDGPLPQRLQRSDTPLVDSDGNEEGGNKRRRTFPAYRVPEGALLHGATTFVPPRSYAAADRILSKERFVVLIGRGHTGRRAAARQLLFDRVGAVYEVDGAHGWDPTATVESDSGYILRVSASPGIDSVVRMMREGVVDARSYLVVCSPPGLSEACVHQPDCCVDWWPLEGEPLIEAVRRHVVEGLEPTRREGADTLLSLPAVQSKIMEVASTADLVTTASVLRRALTEQWDEDITAASLGRAGRVALCERVRSLADLRTQAWFTALALLAPLGIEDLTRAAECLYGHLRNEGEASAHTTSPFATPSRHVLLDSIGATAATSLTSSTADSSSWAIPGADPPTAFTTFWTELSPLRDPLVAWLADLAKELSAEALPSLAGAAATLIRLDRQRAFDDVLQTWAHHLRVQSVVLMDAALRSALHGGAEAKPILSTLHRWACSSDLSTAVTALLTLGGSAGAVSGPQAVALLRNVLRRGDVGRIQKRTAATALAMLLNEAEAADDVLAYMRKTVDDVMRTAAIRRTEREHWRIDEVVRVLHGVDARWLSTAETRLRDDAVIDALARLFVDLLSVPQASKRGLDVLARWAGWSRSNALWSDWYVELLQRIVRGSANYRTKTAIETLLRRLSTEPLDKPLVERIRGAAKPADSL